MSFHVDPQDLRKYADQLADASRAAETAKAYVHEWGDFSAHEKGLLGLVWPSHSNYVSQIHDMLAKLVTLTDTSSTAVGQTATLYERTDSGSAAEIDASYPEVPRVPTSRD